MGVAPPPPPQSGYVSDLYVEDRDQWLLRRAYRVTLHTLRM